MAEITVYSKGYCPYCSAAKALLDAKGAEYTLIDVTTDAAARDEMLQRSNGARTVPQIFIGEQHIGGFDDLNALHKAGEL
ncbi:MAG: glutaredoxin 3, partial [Pseudomonadota bacterium]